MKGLFSYATALIHSTTSCLKIKIKWFFPTHSFHQHCVGRKKYSPSCRSYQMLGLSLAKWVKGQSHTHSLGSSSWRLAVESTKGSLVGEGSPLWTSRHFPCDTSQASSFCSWKSSLLGERSHSQRRLYTNSGLPRHCVQGTRPSAQASWPLGILLLKWKNRDCKVL